MPLDYLRYINYLARAFYILRTKLKDLQVQCVYSKSVKS